MQIHVTDESQEERIESKVAVVLEFHPPWESQEERIESFLY